MKCVREYTVKFGSMAWTIDYEDESGRYSFVFESDFDEYQKKGTTKKIFLYQLPSKDAKAVEFPSQKEREHLSLLVERVKQFLLSIGYVVELK